MEPLVTRLRDINNNQTATNPDFLAKLIVTHNIFYQFNQKDAWFFGLDDDTRVYTPAAKIALLENLETTHKEIIQAEKQGFLDRLDNISVFFFLQYCKFIEKYRIRIDRLSEEKQPEEKKLAGPSLQPIPQTIEIINSSGKNICEELPLKYILPDNKEFSSKQITSNLLAEHRYESPSVAQGFDYYPDHTYGYNDIQISNTETKKVVSTIDLGFKKLKQIIALSESYFVLQFDDFIEIYSTHTFKEELTLYFNKKALGYIATILQECFYVDKTIPISSLRNLEIECLTDEIPENDVDMRDIWRLIGEYSSNKVTFFSNKVLWNFCNKLIKDAAEETINHDAVILLAAKTGQWDIVSAGLDKGIKDINKSFDIREESRKTILWFAAKAEQWDLVKRICLQYPNVNVNATHRNYMLGMYQNEWARCVMQPGMADLQKHVLWFALYHANLEMVRFLHARNADLGNSPREELSDEMLKEYEHLEIKKHWPRVSLFGLFAAKESYLKDNINIVGYSDYKDSLSLAQINKKAKTNTSFTYSNTVEFNARARR